MSVDVEDWFQVENLRAAVSRESWDTRERRVVANTQRLLSVFDRTGVTGTFFCLGWVAEREPSLIRDIVSAGHEIASHGYAHRLIYEQPLEEFRQDVVRAKALLEDISGQEVLGYRAPSFSITADSLAVLAETGHRYDSSWFPAQGHDRYGRLDLAEEEPRGNGDASTADSSRSALAVRPVMRLTPTPAIREPFFELPITTRRLAGRVLPWGGGGWFRLIPAGMFRRGFLRAVTRSGGGVFYLHPWEVDPDQPRVEGIRRDYAFRHYVNLKRTEDRLERLCRTVPFARADRVLKLR
tara:strand:- start:616 stop:1503 length:888 start_codon:yes stop_codon:yes gene_type:complete